MIGEFTWKSHTFCGSTNSMHFEAVVNFVCFQHSQYQRPEQNQHVLLVFFKLSRTYLSPCLHCNIKGDTESLFFFSFFQSVISEEFYIFTKLVYTEMFLFHRIVKSINRCLASALSCCPLPIWKRPLRFGMAGKIPPNKSMTSDEEAL